MTPTHELGVPMSQCPRDYGHEAKVALEAASVSGLGMSPRLGACEGATRGHPVYLIFV